MTGKQVQKSADALKKAGVGEVETWGGFAKKQGSYVSLDDGESIDLYFRPILPTAKDQPDFGGNMRRRYTSEVITREGERKLFSFGPQLLAGNKKKGIQGIAVLIDAGKRFLRITRIGVELDTRYNLEPIKPWAVKDEIPF